MGLVAIVGVLGCEAQPVAVQFFPPDTNNIPIPLVDSAELASNVLVVGNLRSVTVPTFDGSGEATEPDVLVGWHGWEFWMAMSPYPHGDATFERPSVVVSGNGAIFETPRGGHNPVADDSIQTSDPDLQVVRDTLWLVYRVNTSTQDSLLMRRTGDGTHWLPSQGLNLRGPWASLLSPALIVTDSFRLWTVNAPSGGCRTTASYVERRSSSDGVDWGPPDTVQVGVPGWVVWHIDVTQIEGSYMMLYAAFPTGGTCGAGGTLFLATSADGRVWTSYPRPVLAPNRYLASGIYRSSMELVGNQVELWYSGVNGSIWRLATERLALAELMNRVR